MPGHSVGLQRGAPELYAKCSAPKKLPDPTTERFFDFLDSIVSELSVIFPDDYLHAGGDEVDTTCWTENPDVVAWMKRKGLNATGALGYFQTRVQEIITRHGKAAMFW